jgi:hypothetical protein
MAARWGAFTFGGLILIFERERVVQITALTKA